jgi:hypothetical protein
LRGQDVVGAYGQMGVHEFGEHFLFVLELQLVGLDLFQGFLEVFLPVLQPVL